MTEKATRTLCHRAVAWRKYNGWITPYLTRWNSADLTHSLSRSPIGNLRCFRVGLGTFTSKTKRWVAREEMFGAVKPMSLWAQKRCSCFAGFEFLLAGSSLTASQIFVCTVRLSSNLQALSSSFCSFGSFTKSLCLWYRRETQGYPGNVTRKHKRCLRYQHITGICREFLHILVFDGFWRS